MALGYGSPSRLTQVVTLYHSENSTSSVVTIGLRLSMLTGSQRLLMLLKELNLRIVQ